jgi:hypothetical protein
MAMKKLHTFGLHEGPLADLFLERLEKEGVSCVLRNRQLFSALGEIPFTECFPELWVVDAEVWPRARTLLDQWLGNNGPGKSWTCPSCRENVEAVFASCWNCGEPHP